MEHMTGNHFLYCLVVLHSILQLERERKNIRNNTQKTFMQQTHSPWLESKGTRSCDFWETCGGDNADIVCQLYQVKLVDLCRFKNFNQFAGQTQKLGQIAFVQFIVQ
jgi:hypothetical protein